MYRHVTREQIIYGHFRDYFATAKELLAYAKSKGWSELTIYSPLAGAANDIVYHADYASLDELEREFKAAMSDADFMELFRRQSDHIVQGSSISEILMTIDDDAV
jgi:hypothetical protein